MSRNFLFGMLALGILLAGCATSQPPSAEKPGETSSGGVQPNNCLITGCSGEICAEPGQTINSICIFQEWYGCYKTTACERQADGDCGWTDNQALRECFSQKGRAGY